MARTTVKLLEAMVEDLKKRVEALEMRKRRVGFEYEGQVSGDVVQSTYYDAGGPGEDDRATRWVGTRTK